MCEMNKPLKHGNFKYKLHHLQARRERAVELFSQLKRTWLFINYAQSGTFCIALGQESTEASTVIRHGEGEE